jgi:glutamate synthase (NADPH/NADH) large chain
MTGGTVVVLGMTGRNFAAGMSGGIAYVFDEDGLFQQRCNLAQVAVEKVLADANAPTDVPLHRGLQDEAQLKDLITRHAQYTGSTTAQAILANWDDSLSKFVKVYPHEYKRALTEIAAQQQKKVA